MKFNYYLIVFSFNIVYAASDPPIFLLHGFMGWGKEELGDFNYWGGEYDIESYLIENGFSNFGS